MEIKISIKMKKVGMSYDNDIDILDWDIVQSDDDCINSKRSCKDK